MNGIAAAKKWPTKRKKKIKVRKDSGKRREKENGRLLQKRKTGEKEEPSETELLMLRKEEGHGGKGSVCV
jgi:hypothetical protein